MNRKIKVSDRKTSRQITDSSAREKHCHSVVAGSIANLRERILLNRREAIF